MANANEKPRLVLLETDVLAVDRFQRIASRLFTVVTTQDAAEAIALVINDHSVRVLVAGTEEGRSTIAVLERVRMERPDVLRIAMACADDLAGTLPGIHSGAIEQTITKPVETSDVVAALTRSARLATLAATATAGIARRRAG